MALSSPNTLSGITRLKNLYSFTLDGVADATDLSPGELDALEDDIELALNATAAAGVFAYYERTSGTLRVIAPYSAGDIDLTAASATATSDNGSTDWSTGTVVNAGRALLKHAAAEGTYLITAVGGAQSMTIDPEWAGSTVTDQDYEIVNADYNLTAGVWDLLTVTEKHPDRHRLQILSHHEFLNRFGNTYDTGQPRFAVILGADPSASGASGTAFRIRLYPYPDQVYAYDYTYRTVPTYPSGTFESSPQAQNLVLWKALEYGSGRRRMAEQAQMYGERWARELATLKRKDTQRTPSAGRQLRPVLRMRGGNVVPDWLHDVNGYS